MRKLYISVSLLLALSTQAQTKDTQAADKLYNQLEYVDAAKAYLKLVEKGKTDGYVYKQLADSYYELFNTKEAKTWYAKAVEFDQNSETHYRYAQMLKAEGDLDGYNKQMNIFAQKEPNDSRAKNFLANPTHVKQIQSQKQLFNVKKSDVSSEHADFAPVLTDQNEVYFASARNQAKKTSKMNKEAYLDIYKAIRNTDGTLTQATEVSELNTKWHDGPVSITKDGNTMYYASESFNESQFQKDKAKHLKFGQIYLYKATKAEGKWSNAKLLSINSKEYSMQNPAISADGKTLYFSSDMPGGKGGHDIWKVSVDGDTFGTPENVTQVNTEGNESFPFITEDNSLYFASNGKPGLGGYDVYFFDNNTQEVKNLGEPVNTSKDDFSFAYNKNLKVAYFSSNREGNDDIFVADPICGVEALIVVKDAETGKPLADAQVVVVNNKGVSQGTQTSSYQGQVQFGLACEQNYGVTASRSGYETNNISLDKHQDGQQTAEVLLKPIPVIITEKEVILQPIFFEYNKSNITPQGAEELDKLVQVMNQNPNMEIQINSHTDSRGTDSFNLKLSSRRAKSTMQYLISKGIAKERLASQGKGETEPKIKCDQCNEEQHAQNRRSEFLIVKK